KTDKTEEITEREQREDKQYPMQADAVADELRLVKRALNELAEEKKADDDHNRNPVRPKQREGNAPGDQQPRGRAKIGNEVQDPGSEADQQTEVQSGQRQSHGIEAAENKRHERLPAHEAGERRIDLARQSADRFPMRARQPGVDLVDHAVP